MGKPTTGLQRGSSYSAVAVTPSDASNLSSLGASLYIAVAGDLKVDMADGTTVTFTAHPAGYAPLLVNKVYATGTTATGIIALY